MAFVRQHTARVGVESIAAGGDGVAHVDGMAVFVPRSAPGDTALVSISPHGRYGRGTIADLIEPSPDRVDPPCPHYVHDRCGGCQLQHLRYDAQLAAKQRIVRDALVRIAKLDVGLPDIVPSPREWGYRSRLSLAIRGKRGSRTVGLHAYDEPDHVFQLETCPITEPSVVNAWREIRHAGDALPDDARLRGVVRLVGGELAFHLEGGTRWDASAAFARRCPSLRLVRWTPEGRTPVTITDRRSGHEPASSFEQVNAALAELLRQALVERVLARQPGRVLDLYAGSGAVARAIASTGIPVTAVELDRGAAAAAAHEAPADLTVQAAAVEDVIDEVLPADVVIMNPPRAGVSAGVTSALVREPLAPCIIYVSCDPATLARDVARLGRYRVTHVQAFDMFPQTAHVETLCELVAASA